MQRFRQTRAAEYGAVTAAMLAVVLPGCDHDEGTTPTTRTTTTELRGVPCQLWDALGDVDCDGVIERDTDDDGIPDPLDRYPGGYDYGDDDGDGYANWIDADPLSADSTVESLPESGDAPAVDDRTDWEAELESQVGAADQEAVQTLLDGYREMQEAHEEYQEGLDTDYDTIPDYQDPQPDLHWNRDQDGDGFYNHEDYFPTDDGRN